MITIYILQTDKLDLSLIEALPVGDVEKSRIAAIEHSQHKKESLGGLIALWRLLKKRGISLPPNIIRLQNGKPCFADGSMPFGISHSHTIAAAALGDADCESIGFDLEVLDNKVNTLDIASRFFSADEQSEFEKNGKTDEAFFSIWTAKEALAKLDGKGLSAILSDTKKRSDIYISRLTVDIGDKRAVLSIACKSKDQPIQIFKDREEQL